MNQNLSWNKNMLWITVHLWRRDTRIFLIRWIKMKAWMQQWGETRLLWCCSVWNNMLRTALDNFGFFAVTLVKCNLICFDLRRRASFRERRVERQMKKDERDEMMDYLIMSERSDVRITRQSGRGSNVGIEWQRGGDTGRKRRTEKKEQESSSFRPPPSPAGSR